MEMQPGNQPQTMPGGMTQPAMNHGGHEIFDVHEVLSGTITILDQYLVASQYVKDPELRDIFNRQYNFLLDEYNMLVQAFSTGQDPAHGTRTYQMKQNNETVYGLKPSQPKKPCQSVAEIKDAGHAGHMMGMLKSLAGSKAIAACETTNPVVRRVIADSIPNNIEMAYEIFLYQNKHGHYQVPQLAQQDMQQMINSYTTMQTRPQLPQPGQPMMQ